MPPSSIHTPLVREARTDKNPLWQATLKFQVLEKPLCSVGHEDLNSDGFCIVAIAILTAMVLFSRDNCANSDGSCFNSSRYDSRNNSI
jgi:hypothetical protein